MDRDDNVLVFERLFGLPPVEGMGQLSFGGRHYRLCKTRISGELEHWMAPQELFNAMLGPAPGLDFVSEDMCSVVPEEAFGVQRWVSCFFHDWHVTLAKRGGMTWSQANHLFGRNSYAEVRWWGGGVLNARAAQARSYVTGFGERVPTWARVPLILLIVAVVVGTILLGIAHAWGGA